MNLVLPALVTIDGRDIHEIRIPGVALEPRRGPSLAEVLDDVAIAIMEALPKTPVSALPAFTLCPTVELRRVAVKTSLRFGDDRKSTGWKGTLSVVAHRWRGDGFWVCTVPRLGVEPFAARSLDELPASLDAYLARWARTGTPARLDQARCVRTSHLELLEVDAELPTVLSSRRPPKKKKTPAPSAPGQPPEARSKKKKKFVAPVTLREVCTSLTHRAIDGALRPAFGRDALVDQILAELERPGAAVLLVGPTGVGKTAILHEIVRRLTERHAPLTERTDVWETDGNRIIAGMSLVGAWEQRVERLVTELSDREDILVVDDLPTLVFTGRSAKSDTHVAGFLEPWLERRSLRIVGECTPERLAATRPEATGFFTHFRLVQVPPLDRRDTLMVLLRETRALEEDRPLAFEPAALEVLLELAERFHARECQPGASARLLRRIADEVVATRTDEAGRHRIGREEVLGAYQILTGLPPFVLSPTEARRPEEIRGWFSHHIVAQPNAVDAVTDLITRLQQGLDDPHRPIATLMLVGPTGVGKTETAKALARWLFGSVHRLLRFDMSEFRGPAAVHRLVGHVRQPDGELTRAVARQPFSVVLFDEIEKADRAVFDVLLQVMGEGRLTNAVGVTTDFTSTVVLLTSNLGVAEARTSVGFGGPSRHAQDAHYRRAAESFFKPEFVNRLDRIVAYRALEREHVSALVSRLVTQLLSRRGLRQSGVIVQVDPSVEARIVDEGFDPAYGARALKRTLEKRLTVPLARELSHQPLGPLTLADVHTVRGELTIDLIELVSGPPPRRMVDLEPRWDVLREAHAELVRRHGALPSSPRWAEAAQARQRLLSTLDGHGAGDGIGEQLVVLGDLVTRWEALRDVLAEVEATALASFEYVEEVEREYYPHPYEWSPSYREVGVSVPVPVDRARKLRPTRRTLSDARAELAALLYRLEHAFEAQEDLLVQVLPESDPDACSRWIHGIAQGFATALAEEGTVRWLERTSEGWAYTDKPGTGLIGAAIHARAPALEVLLVDLSGLWIDVEQVGPDTIARLARVSLLHPGDDAVATLAADDQAMEAWRAARARGTAGPSPRPVPRLVVRSGIGGDLDGTVEEHVRSCILGQLLQRA